MKARAFEIDPERRLIPISPDQVAEDCRKDNARIWLDLEGDDPDERTVWLDRLAVRGLARRICLEAGDRAGFYPLNDELILVIPVLAKTQGEVKPDHVVFVCRPQVMISLHNQPALDAEVEATTEDAAEWMPGSTIASLVAAILMDATQDCLDHSSGLRQAVITLEDRFDHDPGSVAADEVQDLRAKLLTMEMIVDEQLSPVKALAAVDRPGMKIEGAREFLNCSLANLIVAARRLDRLATRIGELRSGLQMYSQDKTNNRLGMLTILSAIFMPITLFAGIWGMNFKDMPELNLDFGYPLALGFMVLVGIGMYLFFRKGGWFGN